MFISSMKYTIFNSFRRKFSHNNLLFFYLETSELDETFVTMEAWGPRSTERVYR